MNKENQQLQAMPYQTPSCSAFEMMPEGIYDTFCRDYKSTIGEDYNISFKSIISSHQN